MRTLPDFLEGLHIIVLSDNRHWSADVETKEGVETFNFLALLHMPPGYPDRSPPKADWTKIQPKKEEKMPGYKNFPWGMYQVFNDDTGEWLGEADTLDGIKEVSRDYLRGIFNAKGKVERKIG